jgi:hypothetical protein
LGRNSEVLEAGLVAQPKSPKEPAAAPAKEPATNLKGLAKFEAAVARAAKERP